MERADELKERIRQQPLNDRLEESRRRIGDMCSKGRCPKMTIPVQHDDDDFYINTTLADAQATIAALQAQLTAARERCRCYTNWWDGKCPESPSIAQLEQQLTQRTAELEAAKQNFDRRTDECNEISKMYVDAQAELERVRAQVQQLEKDNATLHQFWMNADDWLAYNDKQAAIQRERDTLRTLVAALPKVEGAVVVSNGYVKDSTRYHALFGADEDAALYAALLQHRQGMEG